MFGGLRLKRSNRGSEGCEAIHSITVSTKLRAVLSSPAVRLG